MTTENTNQETLEQIAAKRLDNYIERLTNIKRNHLSLPGRGFVTELLKTAASVQHHVDQDTDNRTKIIDILDDSTTACIDGAPEPEIWGIGDDAITDRYRELLNKLEI